MITIRVRVFPEVSPDRGGGFAPDTFDHLLHLKVQQPGLDPAWDHTLIDATVDADGSGADLTLRSEPRGVKSLDRSLRLATWQPAAHIRARTPNGDVLETTMDAPLQPGQLVEVAGKSYRVAPASHGELWPHRDPTTGICRGDIDWQHVTLIPERSKGTVPTVAT